MEVAFLAVQLPRLWLRVVSVATSHLMISMIATLYSMTCGSTTCGGGWWESECFDTRENTHSCDRLAPRLLPVGLLRSFWDLSLFIHRGTVHMEATHDSGPHKPDAFMLLVAGSIAAQRSGVQTASFRDVSRGPCGTCVHLGRPASCADLKSCGVSILQVQRGEVTGLMWDHGMVMDEMTVHLEAGETVTMSLAVSKPVLHLMTLYREDGASLIPLVSFALWF